MRRWALSEIEIVAQYTRAIAAVLGLGHWTVNVVPNLPSDKTAEAEISTLEGMTADIHLGKDFFRRTPYTQREILVHELCHLPGDWCDQNIKYLVSVKATALSKHVALLHEQGMEHVAQHWARLLAPRMPLPDFPINVEPIEVVKK